jgi:translocation and assembly module TamB
MRLALRRILRALLAALLLPLALVAVLLVVANTEGGQRLVAWGLGQATGGSAVLTDLEGTLPFAPRIGRLELRDGEGVWLAVDGAELDLDPWRLLRGELAVEALTARSLVVARLPAGEGAGGGWPIRLPLRLQLERLAIEDLQLDGVVPGAPRLAVEAGGTAGGEDDLRGTLLITAPGRSDRYRLEAEAAGGRLRLLLAIQESPGGLLAALAGSAGVQLPAGLADWRLDAKADGPFAALALSAKLDAGPLQAAANGTIDLEARSATVLQLSADLPAMTLAPEGRSPVAWERIALKADLSGPLLAPQGKAQLEANGLAYGDWGLARLTLGAEGDPAGLGLDGELLGLRGPVELPQSAATVPMRIAGELGLADPARPVSASLRHPLVELTARGGLTDRAGQANASLPDLAALSGLVGVDLAGSARLELKGAADGPPRVEATGELALARAPGPLVALLGPTTRLAIGIAGEGNAWRISQARIDGTSLKAEIQGLAGADALALDWTLDLTDLAALDQGWSGRIQAKGALSGTPKAPALAADLDAQAAFDSAATGRLAGRVDGRLSARPAGPSGSLDLKGDWAGQPVTVGLRAERLPDGALSLVIAESRWASVATSGTLRLAPGATLPQGEVWLRADRLADLAPLLPAGSGLAGRLTASLVLDRALARVEAQGEGLVLPGSVDIRTLILDARVSDPQGAAQTQATLRVTGLAAGQVSGDLSLTARGPAAGLDLAANSTLATPMGPASLAAAGRLNARARRLGLQRLEASAKGETLRLSTPATLDLADGIAVDRLRLGLDQGTIELAGRATPRLDLDATVTRLPLELARLIPGGPPLAGTLGAQIRLAGALDAPTGTIRIQASGLSLTEGAGRAIPPAELKLSADLGASATEIDAQAEIRSRANLRLRGRIGGRLPSAPGALALRADGRMDLALLDPLLTGGGRQVSGQAILATGISGTLAAPRLDGTLRLADGAIRDRTIGLSLTGVQGQLALAGDTVRVQRLVAQAGRGTVAIEGSVGVLAPGIPIDLRLIARNARPVQLDLIDVLGDADLRLAGRMAGRLDASGSVRFQRIDIRLPEQLPPTIAVLEVRERGSTRRPATPERRAPSVGPLDLGLDLRLSAPRAVFVSGRGVDAELGGEVQVRGTQADPQIDGGFNLLRGEYELIGQTLRFTRGRIGFEGAAVTDPSLDLEARVTAAGSTAILAVQGTARAPRIVLRGEPELPQDEVLARLLFGVAGGRLSAVQAARLGMAAASLAGIGDGGGPGVLDRTRTGLGLDRLSIGTDERGDASLEGGRYIAEGVYLGARQGARAGETQGVLRIEVTPQIRLEADVGAAGGTRGGAAYEREY